MYMVIFRTADGKPGYQPAEDVQVAGASVERLRNEEGVENVRIYRMEEVAFEYKVHYTVQIAGANDAASAHADAVAAPGEAAPVADEVAGEPDQPSWSDDSSDADDESAPPFDQMAVDPAGAPQWDDDTEDEPASVAPPEPAPVPAESDARRGLFGR